MVKLIAAFVAGLALASLVHLYKLRELRRAPAEFPEFVGGLKLEDDEPAATLHVEGRNTLVFVPFKPIKAPDGKVFEIWLTPTRGPDFVLLVRIDRLGSLRLAPKEVPELGNGDRIMVVVEQPGGAASGKMEGPFVMLGELNSRL
ncbi:MAG: anti-sigma factor domain-containing protein [Beijerinckiaceae bacterium]